MAETNLVHAVPAAVPQHRRGLLPTLTFLILGTRKARLSSVALRILPRILPGVLLGFLPKNLLPAGRATFFILLTVLPWVLPLVPPNAP